MTASFSARSEDKRGRKLEDGVSNKFVGGNTACHGLFLVLLDVGSIGVVVCGERGFRPLFGGTWDDTQR